MDWWVLGDEVLRRAIPATARSKIANHHRWLGGPDGVIAVDREDVVEAGNGPVGAKGTVCAVVHGIFRTQAGEQGPPAIRLVEGRVTDIDFGEVGHGVQI